MRIKILRDSLTNGIIVDIKMATLIYMSKILLSVSLSMLGFTAMAAPGNNEIGLLAGPSFITYRLSKESGEYTSESAGYLLGFLYERRLDRAQSLLHLSFAAQTGIQVFSFSETYKKEYFDASMSYPVIKDDTAHGRMKTIYLAAGLGINITVLRQRNLTMIAAVNALPAIEAGNFDGGFKFNTGASLSYHIVLAGHIVAGVRVQQMLDGYWSDIKNIPVSTKYVPTHFLLDMRYRL